MQRIIAILILTTLGVHAEDRLLSRLYSDRTARQVGDLVTIQIEEQSSVQKDSTNDRDKTLSGGMSFDLPGMTANNRALWNALSLPEWNVDANKSFAASGSKASSDAFSASITVYVTEVLPNGNLLICGDRKVNIDGDVVQFTLTGTVRPDDIDRENNVLSSRVADALITYKTTGEFSKSQRKGLISRVVDWIIPF
ncbi:MAG: flagellar basal body L-ring protein FlgH [Pontiellaceae bacterium]|nr:flagellar basal body L-ring protein FlgH [Pontiellaceae bacterium]MBN2784130.1 flagellar basal body L-ring protein FlgH [Pontiellaceae bacterium]